MKQSEFKKFAEQRISQLQQSGPVWIDPFTTRQMLFISKSTLRRWEQEYGLTRHKMGGKVYYDKREIDAVITKRARDINPKIIHHHSGKTSPANKRS